MGESFSTFIPLYTFEFHTICISNLFTVTLVQSFKCTLPSDKTIPTTGISQKKNKVQRYTCESILYSTICNSEILQAMSNTLRDKINDFSFLKRKNYAAI